MLKSLLKILFLLGLCVIRFGADDFSEAQTTMSSVDLAGKSALGVGVKRALHRI